MQDAFHATPLWVIFIALLAFLPICIQAGSFTARFLTKRGLQYRITETIPTSILGLHALLIGFTFSIAVERYEFRRDIVVREANAIGTAHLRSKLLPSPADKVSQDLFAKYLDQQVKFGRINHSMDEAKAAIVGLRATQAEIWKVAQDLIVTNRSPIEASYVAALNEMFDVHNERVHALLYRLPMTVLALLLVTLGISLLSLGFAEAINNRRSGFWLFLLTILFSVVLTLIVDLDRPRRGLITVSQAPMEELQQAIQAESPAP